MLMFLHEDFYAAVGGKPNENANAVFLGDLRNGSRSNQDRPQPVKGHYVSIERWSSFKTFLQHVEDYVKLGTEAVAVETTVEEAVNTPAKRMRLDEPKPELKTSKKGPLKKKGNATKKQAVSPQKHKTKREKEMEKVLLRIYANELGKHISDISAEQCFGCIYDKPGQRDHDICLMTSYDERVEQFIENASSRVDNKIVNAHLEESGKLMDPPLTPLEKSKYCSKEYQDGLLHSKDGIEQVKALIIKEH